MPRPIPAGLIAARYNAGMNNNDDDDGFARLREESFETSEELKYRTGNHAGTKQKARVGFAIALAAILLIVATAVVLLKVI
jgi:hypothetical protein